MYDFTARAGMTIRAATGLEALGVPNRMATLFFCEARAGDRLTLLDRRYYFNVATYDPEIAEKYLYTFAYQPNQSWTKYAGDLSGETYRQEDYIFSRKCYFRLCFKRADGADFDEAEAEGVGERIISFVQADGLHNEAETKPFITQEAARLARRIEAGRGEGDLLFALLADSHCVVNGTWSDTLASIRAVHAQTPFDGLIHLGDLTDGMVTAAATKIYVNHILGDLRKLDLPVYITIGNHDTNYFNKNTEPIPLREQAELYLSPADAYTVREADAAWYYRDFPVQGLRFCFLHSYDYAEQYRYGYAPACLAWLDRALEEMPVGYRALVFSHLPPLVELQVWTDHIRGGAELVEILERHRVVAYLNGHNHADHIYCGRSFPIISIGCAKLEYFLEHKPVGATVPRRSLGEASQELWDALLVSRGGQRLSFLRFGAGEDRVLCP
jgi:hypothetical protein